MKSALLRFAVPVAALIAATAASIVPVAQAAEFSCSTAKLIVPWKPGGGTDVIFRIYANAINGYGMKPHLQVVNISGQGGNKGAKEAKKSKPDGCTLFAIHQSAITSYLNGRIDFTWDAFDTVSLLTDSPDIVGAAGDAPWNNLTEMLDAGRKNPETILTGATFGSTSQFMWLLMEDMSGAKFKYVPFDGTRERMTALLANNIQLGTLNVVAGKKYLNGGQLKAFGIAADERSDQLPDLPTLKEQGLNLVYSLKRGIVVQKGTPNDKIDHWAAAFKKASEDPDLLKQMQAKGTGVKWVGPADYAKWFDKTYKDHEKVAIKIGMFKK
ncbi:MAG: tripartite tricarboxylate transporter substrate binding protein [Gammaproteobacteria bacterium]|jgi:tripartite-type tricarboxylate transporter receptor subunit TctC|nr:tripartite tricarboxylate transporter substrate binding protein [Gammaproteobacteria bacterium]NCF82684.1 tripartite tricarboxylate transporter substrate binding protein [Pseudomonadota bacterium]